MKDTAFTPLFTPGADPKKIPILNKPVLFYCGCGGIKSKVDKVVSGANIKGIDRVKLNANVTAKRYVQLNGLDKVEPSLGKNTYGVIHHPNGALLDIINGDPDEIIAKAIQVYRGEL